ncbi:MCE family protein [Amycolatopsis cihanbeyliensis]|uniref:Phospholipid/cholesterol/gamma-HCH transport system substrate-binding protein n=1 Tax=Amycolatopsis cihanbeyliensis TaxID=1128664 RepID=A0A542CSG9_AMYCI|nr:MCE family protein [Amycolatopsis cihanbeyliensis]TQI93720.1 phospholipid/cholesterol/gamma-HCH transport system substrate-binding protein [Amycolatopsis cihanbeyliensis]
MTGGIPPRRGPVRDGAIGAVVLLLVVALAIAVPRLSFRAATHAYSAEFGNAAGLTSGDQVYVAGVPAGRVTGVALAGDRVRVDFRLDSGQPLGAGSGAAVKLGTILGTRYLSVRPAGEGALPAGGTIPLERTSVPYSLNDIGTRAADTAQAFDLPALRRMIEALRRHTPDGELLGKALDGVGRASELVRAHGGRFRELLAGVRSLTSTLLDERDTLTRLLGDAELVAELLSSRRETIRSIIAGVHELSTALENLLRENEPLLGPLLADLHTITDTLSRNAEAIGETLRLLGPASRYLADATGNGPWGDVSAPAGPLPDNLLCVAGLLGGCR